jgi:hypothetical protein
VAEELEHKSVFLMADGTALDGLFLEAGHVFLQKCKGPVERILMTGYAVGIIVLMLLGFTFRVKPAVSAAGQVVCNPLVREGKPRGGLIHMTYDQAVNLFHLSMREFLNTGVAVGTFQITMRAVKIKVFGNVQQPEFTFLTAGGVLPFAGDIAQPPIPVAEKAILFVNRPGTVCKEENASQDEQGHDCRARRHPFRIKKSFKRLEVDHTIKALEMCGFIMFIGCVYLSHLRDHN